MAKIHMILQGKGGVGKSLIAALIAQYKAEQNEPVLCIDTDPVNSTLAAYRGLEVQVLKILEDNKIDARQFDTLMNNIETIDRDVIIDNGASSFIALTDYLITNDAASLIGALGHELVIHTVITGGQAITDTLHGFNNLLKSFAFAEGIKFVVWLNPYWGVVEYEGKCFAQMKAYLEHKHLIAGIIEMPSLQRDTFGRDFSDMLQERKTFAQALADSSYTLMQRQRLKIIRTKMFDAIGTCEVI